MDTFTILLTIVGANLFVLLLNAVFWVMVSKGDKKLKKQEEGLYERFQEILEGANKQASEMLIKAAAKSNHMLSDTEVVLEDIKQEMRRNFTLAKAKNTELLEHHMEELQKDNREFLNNLRNGLLHDAKGVMHQMLSESRKEMHRFVDEIKSETVLAQREVEQKLSEEFVAAHNEIKNYKKQQINAIDTQIVALVSKVVRNLLPEALQINDQERLILDAFDKAKEDQIFTEYGKAK